MLISYGVNKYNNLVQMSNAVDAQWAQVDSVLQRRFDSISQAIGAIKGAKDTEVQAIQLVTEARKIYTAANGNTEAQVAAANNYSGALNGLLLARSAVQEAYPNLKTPDLVGGLVGGVNVEGNENRINVERQRYNEMVRDYNNSVTMFPSNLFANMFGFAKRTYFEIQNAAASAAPSTNF
jgi:LemA protein